MDEVVQTHNMVLINLWKQSTSIGDYVWKLIFKVKNFGIQLQEIDYEIYLDILENSEPRIKCGKPLFALRTSISNEFITHV